MKELFIASCKENNWVFKSAIKYLIHFSVFEFSGVLMALILVLCRNIFVFIGFDDDEYTMLNELHEMLPYIVFTLITLMGILCTLLEMIKDVVLQWKKTVREMKKGEDAYFAGNAELMPEEYSKICAR